MSGLSRRHLLGTALAGPAVTFSGRRGRED